MGQGDWTFNHLFYSWSVILVLIFLVHMESYDIAALPTPAEMLHHLKGPSFINRGLMIKGLAYWGLRNLDQDHCIFFIQQAHHWCINTRQIARTNRSQKNTRILHRSVMTLTSDFQFGSRSLHIPYIQSFGKSKSHRGRGRCFTYLKVQFETLSYWPKIKVRVVITEI